MSVFVITPANAASLDAAHLPTGFEPVIESLVGFDIEALNAVRGVISAGDLQGPARFEGQPCTVDALVDHLVAALCAQTPGIRVRDPLKLKDEEFEPLWGPVRNAYITASFAGGATDFDFFVDGEPEAMGVDALYDVFEEALFPDEGEGDEDDDFGEEDEEESP